MVIIMFRGKAKPTTVGGGRGWSHMSRWAHEEVDREVPAYSGQDTGVGQSFDDLARSIAGGTMPRRRVLRLFGGALVGTAMAFIPGVAEGKVKKCKGEFYEGYHRKCKANEFFNNTTCTCEPTICPEVICCCQCGREGVVLGCTTEFTTLDQCTNWCFTELGGEGASFSCLPNEFNPNSQVFCGPDNTGCTGAIPC